MAVITLAALRSDVADRADMDGIAGPVSAAQMNQRINAAITYVYREICKVRGDEYFEVDMSPDITTVNGTQEYALPANFLKISAGGVWWITGAGYNLPIHKYRPNESMAQVTGAGWYYQGSDADCRVRYRLRVGNIRFVPIPIGAYTVRVKYIPRPPVLALDADTWDGYGGFEEAVKWHAAASCKAKEESDNGFELQMFKNEMQCLYDTVDRDDNEPPTVQWATSPTYGAG